MRNPWLLFQKYQHQTPQHAPVHAANKSKWSLM
jgi:hypothetical protein